MSIFLFILFFLKLLILIVIINIIKNINYLITRVKLKIIITKN